MKFIAGLTLIAAVAALPSRLDTLDTRDAKPQQKCENPGRFVAIVIDASGSNAITDPNNLRLNGGVDALHYLTPANKATDSNKADKVTVVEFTDESKVLYPLGDPNTQAESAIKGIDSNGGTAVYIGVETALQQIGKAGDIKGRGGLIVFTDGQDMSKDQLLGQLANAKARGIRVSLGHLNPNGQKTQQALGGGGGGLLGAIGSLLDPLNLFSGGGGTELDPAVSAAVQATGGTAATISDAAAQQAFVQQVLKNGITNNDGKCSGLDVDQSGGPIEPSISTGGLCSNNAKAVFTYTAKSKGEQLAVAVALVSKSNPVNLNAVIENKVTGQKSQVTVNKGSPALALNAVADAGQEVTVTITPSGADNSQTCQYTVTLATKTTNPIEPSSAAPSSALPSSAAPSSAAPSSAAPSSAAPSSAVPSSAAPSSAAPSSAAPSSAAPSSAAPSSAAPSSAAPSSAAPSSAAPSSGAPQPSSAAPSSAAPSSAAPSSAAPSSAAPSSEAQPSSSQPPVSSAETSSAAPSATSAPASCASAPVQTVVTTVFQTVTVPGPSASAAPPTASVCICKCDAPGAKPFPKFEL